MTRKVSHSEKREPLLENFLSQLRFLKVWGNTKRGSVVADLGCGYKGAFLRKISGKIKSGIGYDISVSNKDLPKNIVLKKVDLNGNIDKRKDYFDVITALAVLEHINNPVRFLKQAKKMLKRNGKLIITTPDKSGKKILEFLSFNLGLISKKEISDHKNYFDKEKIESLAKNAELKIIKIGTFEFGWNIIFVGQKVN